MIIIMLNYMNLRVLTQHINWNGVIKQFIVLDFRQILNTEDVLMILGTVGPALALETHPISPGARGKGYSNLSWISSIRVLGPGYYSNSVKYKTVTSLLESNFSTFLRSQGQ